MKTYDIRRSLGQPNPPPPPKPSSTVRAVIMGQPQRPPYDWALDPTDAWPCLT